MPAVASKFLDNYQKRQLFNINSEYIAGAIFLSSIGYYWGPQIYSFITNNHGGNKSSNSTNNNQQKPLEKHIVPNEENSEILDNELKDNSKHKLIKLARKIPALNIDFIFQFLRLIRIMIPSLFCKETALLSGHTVSLIIRTFLSIYVASMEGKMVKYIVKKDAPNFIKMLIKWFSIALPATFINSMIRYLESKLALAFRTRLVEHSYKLYFKNQVYYRTSNLDSRLDNCSQRLTDDIETVASVIARLYSQITKPLFDLLLIGIALAKLTISNKASLIQGPIVCCSVVGITACILRLVSPKFGQLVALEAEKRGHLRHLHARLITNAEEIAFYNGYKVELNQLKSAYGDLCGHLNKIFGIKLWFVCLEQFLMKYCWSGAGMIVVSLPILLSTSKNNTGHGISERTEYFTTAKNLLQGASDAVERLMSSYKEIVELSGHTNRIDTMFNVFIDVSNGKYKKNVVNSQKSTSCLVFNNGIPVARGTIVKSPANIEIINIPIVTPNCDIVCERLSLKLTPGMHLLITGPNGCGKSSLFRILSGLWPIYNGELKVPDRKKLFYIPQRPYLTLGTLRDQIIYPDTQIEMKNKQKTDRDLTELLMLVKLEHLIKRDTWDLIKDWNDILSGGEKQRLSMARLFYHKPKYALLDECTSATSIDIESFLYETAINLNITLLTITHRPTLWKFHTHILQFDGEGGWTFGTLDAGKRLELKNEKAKLLEQPKSEERDRKLVELSKLLGEDCNI